MKEKMFEELVERFQVIEDDEKPGEYVVHDTKMNAYIFPVLDRPVTYTDAVYCAANNCVLEKCKSDFPDLDGISIMQKCLNDIEYFSFRNNCYVWYIRKND